jgi:hypothetical protein
MSVVIVFVARTKGTLFARKVEEFFWVFSVSNMFYGLNMSVVIVFVARTKGTLFASKVEEFFYVITVSKSFHSSIRHLLFLSNISDYCRKGAKNVEKLV